MKTKLFQRVMALLSVAILLVSVLPAGSALASEKPETPKISVKAVNGTDVKVTIEKTKGADGYEVWITSDCGYTGYKNENHYFTYSYNDESFGDYINAATVDKNGKAVRTITIKNLSKPIISIKVRAYVGTHYTDGGYNRPGIYGDFSKAKSIEVTAQKKGYKSSYDFAKVKRGETIKFGSYEQNYPVDGKDPIEWVILDKGTNEIFIMSKYALDNLPYNVDRTEVTWETCTLRKWLNECFYDAAFNNTEKTMILNKTVLNSNIVNRSYPETESGSDTKDKVFLLSFEDFLKEGYGFYMDNNVHNIYNARDINRRCAPSCYAVAQGAYHYIGNDNDCLTADNEGGCSWWLRSSGSDNESAAFVYDTGRVKEKGCRVKQYSLAVRPAMWIKLKSE